MPLVRMSFSAMPAALIAAITLFICVALAASAALASAAWVTTPVDSEATFGTRLASAWAETESSVPSLEEMVGGWVWALAVMVMQLRARALASASGRKGLRVMEIGRAPSELQSLMRISYDVFCLKKNITVKGGIQQQNLCRRQTT